MKKIKVYNIVFNQSDRDLNAIAEHFQTEDWTDVSDKNLVEYLKQWEQPTNEMDFSLRDASEIDSELLGYRIDKRRTKSGYLLIHNSGMNYCGLSFFEEAK